MTDLPSGVVTFVFADIEGSTRLFAQLGAAWLPLLEEHNRLILDAAAGRGGAYVKAGGDSVFLAFADASEAVTACVEAQQALEGHPWPPEAVIRSRMGVHTGEAAPTGHDYIALAVHQAARVTDTGHGGQIVVSDATARAAADSLPSDVALLPIGRYVVRDFPEPVQLHEARRPWDSQPSPALRAPQILDTAVTTRRTSFVGRNEELRLIAEALELNRMITLTGLSGVGKTRLAVEVAASKPNSYLVELAPIAAGEDIDSALAAAVGTNPGPATPPLEAAIGALRRSPVLLVLDNCEHVLETTARTVDRILGAVPSLTILATSQLPLDVPGEQVIRLGALELPTSQSAPLDEVLATDAGRLFTDRARAADAGFVLQADDGPALARLCHALDGLPLAIELAAARAALLGVDAVAGQTGDLLTWLGGGSRVGPDRHRTVRSAIEWSYGLLDESPRVVLRRLAVFRGTFSMLDADAVVGVGAADGIAALTRGSLVARVPGEGRPQFRLLESVRAFARDQLDGAGEGPEYAGRHTEWVISRVGAMSPTAALVPDIDAALSFAFGANQAPERGITLGTALLQHSGAYPLASLDRHVVTILERDELSPIMRTRVLLLLAEIAVKTGARTGVKSSLDAIAAARSSGYAVAEALNLAGSAHARAGLFGDALGMLGESADIAAAAGDTSLALKARLAAASARVEMGDVEVAAAELSELVPHMRALGHRDLGRALNNWAIALERMERYDEAVAAHHESLRIRQSAGDSAGETSTLINLSSVLTRAGRYEETAMALDRALGIAVEHELTGMLGIVVANVAELATTRGEHAAAASLFGAAARYYTDVGRPLSDGIPSGSESFAEIARAALGAGPFVAALVDGGHLTTEAVVATSRQVLLPLTPA